MENNANVQGLIDDHFSLACDNRREAKAHADISVKFAIKSIEDIILSVSHPGQLLDSIQIKMNELKQLITS
jgi:hypothetical protein